MLDIIFIIVNRNALSKINNVVKTKFNQNLKYDVFLKYIIVGSSRIFRRISEVCQISTYISINIYTTHVVLTNRI